MVSENRIAVGGTGIPTSNLYYYQKIYDKNGKLTIEGWYELSFTKYQIKESDLRIKTMSFTSPTYIDLTRGKTMVKIISDSHENFYGYILSVEEQSDGLYSYSCQDFNRTLSEKISWGVENTSIYSCVKALLGGEVDATLDLKTYLSYTDQSKLLLPIGKYKQAAYEDIQAFNPMEKKISAIFSNQTRGDIIRSLLYQNNVFVDFYFPNAGTSSIDAAVEPYSPEKWLGEGLYFTTPELAEWKMKFDTTNVITDVYITSSDSKKNIKTYYSSKDLLGLDLSLFFGRMMTTVDTPVKQTTTTSTTSDGGGSGAGVATGTTIYINSDNIYSKSKDAKMLDDVATALKSHGYNVINPHHINPGYHVSDLRDNVPKNSCYFPIFGGICSGTLVDMCSNYYQQYMKNKNVKVVLGFLAPPVKDDLDTLTWLKRAWDDNFSSRSFTGLANPGKYLKEHGFTYIYGSSGTDLGNKFYSGGGGLTTVAK